MPDNWRKQLEDFDFSNVLKFAPYIVGAAALIVLLLVARKILRWLSRSKRPVIVDPSLVIDVGALQAPASDAGLRLSVYHVPVRLAGVVIAPLGRDAEAPSRAGVPKLLNAAVPGLAAIASSDQPVVRVWPRQLSATGFANSFARHVMLPGTKGKGSPWCLVAGRISAGQQSFAVGLLLAAAAANNLSLISVESEHKWLRVLRVRRE